MQQEKEFLDNRLGAERQQELDARKAASYEKRYGELAINSIGEETVLTFEPDF